MFTFLDHIDEKLTLKYHDKLNQRIFDGESLREDVKIKLLEIAVSWQKFAKIPENLIKDIILTGSVANYNYTKYSDLDVHLVIDRDKLFGNREYVDEYLSDKKTLWSLTRKIRIKGYPVELYAQDSNEKLIASGVYSLRKNEWISKPVHGNYNFTNDPALEKKVDEMKDTIYNMIKNQSSEENFKIMKEKIKNMRKAALLSGDEFSFDNLIFKSLRSEGIFDKMNKYLEKIRDKKLSL